MPSRPWLIWVFCVLCFIRGFFNMLLPLTQGRATSELLLITITTLGLLGAMFGFFLMKRWGFYLLLADLAFFLVVNWNVLRGISDPSVYFYALGLVTGLVYFRRMS